MLLTLSRDAEFPAENTDIHQHFDFQPLKKCVVRDNRGKTSIIQRMHCLLKIKTSCFLSFVATKIANLCHTGPIVLIVLN